MSATITAMRVPNTTIVGSLSIEQTIKMPRYLPLINRDIAARDVMTQLIHLLKINGVETLKSPQMLLNIGLELKTEFSWVDTYCKVPAYYYISVKLFSIAYYVCGERHQVQRQDQQCYRNFAVRYDECTQGRESCP